MTLVPTRTRLAVRTCALIASVAAAPAAASVFINEVLINPPGSTDDTREFIELRGTPGKNLDGFAVAFLNGMQERYFPIGTIPPAPGEGPEIDEWFSLDGLTLGPNGLLVLGISFLQDYPEVLPDAHFRGNWATVWNGGLDVPGKLQNDGSNTIMLVRQRPGVTQARPQDAAGLRWGKAIRHDAELITPVIDPQTGKSTDQWGDGELDWGQADGMGGATLDLTGAGTPEYFDDLEVVDEVSYEHDRGWEYDADARRVDLGSTSGALPPRRVHALDDPQGVNPDCLVRVDHRLAGAGWPTAAGAVGEAPGGSNWPDTATEQWIRGEITAVIGPTGPLFHFDNSANKNPEAVQPFMTHVPSWLDDGEDPDYDYQTPTSYRTTPGRLNPLARPFIPGDANRDGAVDDLDLERIAAVFGDDAWAFGNAFTEAEYGNDGDPSAQLRPWDLDATGDHGVDPSDLQWALNFFSDAAGLIAGLTYTDPTPVASGVHLNPSAGLACAVRIAADPPALSAVPAGSQITLQVAVEVTAGANLAAGQENGVMQVLHDLHIDDGAILRIEAVEAQEPFRLTRPGLMLALGDAGDLGIQGISAHTTSFTAGLKAAAGAYSITLNALAPGTTTVRLQPTTQHNLAAGAPHGLKVGHTLEHGEPETVDYPEPLQITVVDQVPMLVSTPPDGAIDARQPSALDGSDPAGWDTVVLTFQEAPGKVQVADLSVESSCGQAPQVASVTTRGPTVTVEFDGAIPTGAWTTLQHLPSGGAVRLGYLPADVNGDGSSAPLDILRLIDGLNGVAELPAHSSDINRSGAFEPGDILRVIDLLNGAGAFDAWNGAELCP